VSLGFVWPKRVLGFVSPKRSVALGPHPEEPPSGGRLEGWAATESVAILRDAALRAAPQDEVRASGTLLRFRPHRFSVHLLTRAGALPRGASRRTVVPNCRFRTL